MSNESTTPGPAGQPRPSLPQFDPNAQDPQALPPAAPTSELPVTPPSTPYAYAATPAPEGPSPVAGPSVPLAATGTPQRTTPAGRWSAKKTALTAGLAIVLASAGAIGAAAAMPAGSTGGDSFRGPGGGRSFQVPGNGQGGFGRQNQQLPNQQGQQLPNLQNGAPGGGIDPNQLSQLDPHDLLDQLNQLDPGADPFSGGGSDDDGTGSGQGSDSGSDGARTT